MASVSGELQLRRGTTAEHQTFTGAQGEVTMDIDKKTLVVHDGITEGGVEVAKRVDLDAEKKEAVDTALAFSIALG